MSRGRGALSTQPQKEGASVLGTESESSVLVFLAQSRACGHSAIRLGRRKSLTPAIPPPSGCLGVSRGQIPFLLPQMPRIQRPACTVGATQGAHGLRTGFFLSVLLLENAAF